MILYLYTENHGSIDGIEDYIDLLQEVLGNRGVEVRVTTALVPNATNMVIDEFTNYVENNKIIELKKRYPETRLVFLLTEFVERAWGVKSFNHFAGVRSSAAIAIFNVYLKIVRDDFPRLRLRDVLTALLYSPIPLIPSTFAALRYLANRVMGRPGPGPIASYLNKYGRLIYFHMRYLGYQACLRYADALVFSHEKVLSNVVSDSGVSIRPEMLIGVIYPELKVDDILANLMRQKELFIEITGSVSHYRHKWIERTNRLITTLGLHNQFGTTQAFAFGARRYGIRPRRGAFSLHPPQTKKWPYSSPTRLYRALAVDYNIPILTHYFGQNPIEDVCFLLKDNRSIIELYNIFSDPDALSDFAKSRMQAYNEKVQPLNDVLTEKLRQLEVA